MKVRHNKITFYVTDHDLIKLKRLSLNIMNKEELFLSLVPSVIGAVRYFTILKLSCLIRLIVVSFLPLDDKIIF